MDPFMKKRFELMMMVLSLLFLNSAVQAAPMVSAMDESRDMLRGESGAEEENENSDAASRWGKTGNQSRSAMIRVAQPLAPIGDSSFGKSSNRGPASVRGPASGKPFVSKKPLPSAKTMVRTMREKKAHQEAAVIVNDMGFFPSTLFVTRGVPVRLFVTGASPKSQCMIIDAFGVRRQIRSHKVEEVVFTPDQPGKFAFTCPMNGARGMIIVKNLEIAERFPASVAAEESAVESASAQSSEIDESDFDSEFRVKH
jgi:hypothetical protein